MTTAVKTLSSSPMTVKVFGVTPSRASGCMSFMTRCLTRCCIRLLNINLLYHTLYLEERCRRDRLSASRVMQHSYAVPHALVYSRGSAPSADNLVHPRACRQEHSNQLQWWRVYPERSFPQTRCNP